MKIKLFLYDVTFFKDLISEGDSENDGTKKLTQIIGYTLEKVPATATADQLEQAVLMTIKVLVFAPRISPLSNVNIDNIAHFMVALCKTSPKVRFPHTKSLMFNFL